MENHYERILQRSNKVTHRVCTEISKLDPEILNWKEAEKKWSVLEVVDHLNKVYDIYLPNFEDVISNAPSLNGDVQKTRRTVLGRLSIYTNKPHGKKVKYKLNTFDFFQPKSEIDPEEILEEFRQKKDRFNELIREARNKNLNNTKMPTAIKRLKFFVGECIDFVMSHEERHMIQIEEVLSKTDTVLEK